MSYFAGALAIAWALTGAAAAYHYGQAERARRQASEARQQLAAHIDAARQEHNRRVDALRKVADAAQVEAQARRVAADAAAAAAGRLQRQLAATRAAAPAAPASAPAGATAAVLGHMLEQCIDRVRLLADFADRAHAAGRVCEQSYEAVMGREP